MSLLFPFPKSSLMIYYIAISSGHRTFTLFLYFPFFIDWSKNSDLVVALSHGFGY